MNRTGLKIAIPFLCLLYCFAFFEVDVPGYSQTFHDVFDTYVHQHQQDDASPSQEFHFSYLLLPVGFSVTAKKGNQLPITSRIAESADLSSNKLYLQNAVLLI